MVAVHSFILLHCYFCVLFHGLIRWTANIIAETDKEIFLCRKDNKSKLIAIYNNRINIFAQPNPVMSVSKNQD